MIQTPLKKILLVRPDAIGDMVLMIPLINTLKERYPHAHIYTLQQAYTAPLLAAHPSVKEVLIDHKKSGQAHGLSGFFRYARFLASYQFDAVLMPYLEPYYARLMWAANIPIRIGDGQKILLRPWSTHPVSLDYRNLPCHEAMQMAQLAKALDPQTKIVDTMDVHLTNQEDKEALALLERYQVTEPFILIHAASGGGNRPWSIEKYGAFIRHIRTHRPDLTLFLTGTGAKENEKVMAILRAAGTTEKTYSLVNQTPLRTLMALIKRAAVVVGTDTGPTHIAAALKTPVLCISPTKFVKSLRWGPWHTRHRIVSASHACEIPCKPYTCTLSTCLDAIGISETYTALIELLDSPKAPSSNNLLSTGVWQSSLPIGIVINNDEDMAYYTPYITRLKRLGFQVTCFQKHVTLREIWKHDLAIIYGKRRPMGWFLLRQSAALQMYVPPVWQDTYPASDDALIKHIENCYVSQRP